MRTASTSGRLRDEAEIPTRATNPQPAMFSGSAASIDLLTQIAVYAFWGVLLFFYFLSAIGQTLRERPGLHLGQDVLRWAALLVMQLVFTGGLLYLAFDIGTDRVGM